MKGRLFIEVKTRSGKSVPGECYFTPPFKIADITEQRNHNPLHMVIMSSSPGILDEDEYEIRIKVAAGAALVLSTQSFQRLFRMNKGASQLTEVHLEAGASLNYLPHPVVPHEASVFKSVNRIKMEAGAELIWGEVITCGRALNGEKFRFSVFESLTEVYREGRLVLKENIRMIPAAGKISGIGMLEGFTHQASMVCLREEKIDIDSLSRLLSQQEGIEFGISATRTNGFVVRILGNAAYKLHELLQTVSNVIVGAGLASALPAESV